MFIVLLHFTETKLKQIRMENQTLTEIKKQLPRGSYKIISTRLNGKYTPGTIRQMFSGNITMSPAVLQEAKEYIRFINPEPKAETPNE
jgi:hypothetical protein